MITIPASKYSTIPLGRLGENERTRILFEEAVEWGDEFPGGVIYLLNRLPDTDLAYPVPLSQLEATADGLLWTVGSSDLSKEGVGACELAILKSGVVAKSRVYRTKIFSALDGSGEAPEPWEEWYDDFLTLAEQAKDAREAIENLGVDADTLSSGSIARVTKTVDPETGEVTLTFHIPRGDTGAKGDPGEKGEKGDQGEKGEKGDPIDMSEYTKTEALPGVVDSLARQGGYYKKPTNGIPASDLAEAYIRATDYATNELGGTVKVVSSGNNAGMYGVTMSSGYLMTAPATTNEVRSGTNLQKPLVPAREHEAVFFGLAKAAGDNTQAVSLNEVGTYTEQAKQAVLHMLGIAQLIGPEETGSTSSRGYAEGQIFTRNGAILEVTDSISTGDSIVPGVNCRQRTIGELIGELRE